MSRYHGKGYIALLKKRQQLKRAGKRKAWQRLGRVASKYRQRMIAANRGGHPVQGKTPPACALTPETRKVLAKVTKTRDGKAVLARFKQFWKIKCPPSVKLIGGGPTTVPLMGMGHTNQVHISNGNKGERGKKTKIVRGRWEVATEKSGKHVILLGKRPMTGSLKFVGYAPVTFYIPPPDIEKAGTHKKGFVWKHKHGEADGKKVNGKKLVWPKVYADRDGKVDGSSNFVYGSTPMGKITTWMFH